MACERENKMGVDYAHVAQPFLVTSNHRVLLLKMSNQIHATYKMRCFEDVNEMRLRSFGKIYDFEVENAGKIVENVVEILRIFGKMTNNIEKNT